MKQFIIVEGAELISGINFIDRLRVVHAVGVNNK